MEKIARICWNTQNWKRPSGSEGKSSSADTYEKSYGFGHEEWLLDDTRVMPDGYHYGFLQPLNIAGTKHHDKTYDIHLFAISPEKHGHKVYIGCLRNAVAINPEESKRAYQYYKRQGWISEMKEQVKSVGGKIGSGSLSPQLMFNVKFKFSQAKICYSNYPVISSKFNNRYVLMNKTADFEFGKDDEGNVVTLDTSLFVRKTKSGETIIDPLHKKIQNAVAELLKEKYSKISLEEGDKSLTSQQRVDIKGICKKTGECHYFEVKTTPAKQSIREALGQILEYSLYNNPSPRASKLYIIGPDRPDEKDAAYLKKLRKMYNLPVWYRWYSFHENKLHDEI